MIILSDGEDTASLTEFDQVLQRVRESMVTVHTISVPLPVVPRPRTRNDG